MKTSKFLLITLILAVFQLILADYFKIFGVKPDLILASAVMAGIFLEIRWAVIFGVAAGIFKDIFSLSFFGPDIFFFGLWSFLCAKLSRKITVEDNLTLSLLVFVVALVQNILSGLLLIYSGNFVPLGIFLRIIILGSLYTALATSLILKIVKVKI